MNNIKEKKLKVLHLLPTTRFSGAENVVCQIINLFKDEIDMVYCSPKGKIEDSLKERNIPYLPLEKFDSKSLEKIINVFKPSLIHAHDIKATILASRFSKEIKIISHIHGNDEKMRKVTLKSLLYNIASSHVSHIFWVSNSTLKSYKFYSNIKEKSSVLYNVIDASEALHKVNLDSNSYNYDVIFLGRLSYPKNPMRLIDVLSLLKEKCNFKCAIVGDGDMKERLVAYVKEKGLSANIDFLGFMNNPCKVLKSSKAMLMTSIYEGTPMCALESLSLGTPIVSTPTDGLKDLIKDDINGYLSDDNKVLADKLFCVITNTSLQKKLSDGAKKSSDDYNNLAIYKEKLGKYYN